MVKQRMTALDVRASVEEMRNTLLGLRLLNIYDISSKMFILRFGHGENKKTVLIENGVRMHLTDLSREKPKVPSQFTLKLRKHVRAWRLSSVTQLQHDRTIDLCFGTLGTEGCFHIIVELFSKGNVILTDHAYQIMMLLRTHRDEDVKLMVREVYPVTNPFEVAAGTIAAYDAEGAVIVQQQQEQASSGGEALVPQQEEGDSAAARQQRIDVLRSDWQTVFNRQESVESVKSLLSAVRHFGPSLAEHVLASTQTKNYKKCDLPMSGDELFETLKDAMLEAWDLARAPLPSGGYLISIPAAGNNKKKTAAPVDVAATDAALVPGANSSAPPAAPAASAANAEESPVERYDDFSPVLLAQYRAPGVTTSFMPSYGKVCDTFFLYTESEKISQHNEKKTNAVLSKRERFERDHARRISGLEREQELNYAKGEMIILNADRIDEAIGLINGALASGIQWDALKALLKRRHAEGHPVAYMIHELSLEKNAMSVLLERELYDDEDDGDVESMVVEVSLSKTAHANATDYFSKKKANQQKLEKTKAATGKAAAGATRKGERVAATQQTKKKIVVERQREWWEKFYWFITSAGDVVFQGRDTQTTEILIRRMMRVGDIVVMCDVEGALPCLLRPMHALWSGNGGGDNDAKLLSDGRQPVSRLSLEEAGAWCVSLSAAWEQKQSIGSWWVFGSQITGGTATGCYLFDGEKNHISPQPLTLGCALLCRVKRSVISGEDRPAAPGEDEEEEEMTAPPPEVNPSAPLPWANVLHDLHELKDGKDYVMPDTAHSLKELPSVESLRVRRPAQTHHHHHQQQQGKHADPKSQLDSNMDEKSDITTATTAATTQQQQHLTKHQKKKLKKIRDRYGDQDDEDRALGMALNGNKLASVQQAELQRVAAEAEQRRALEKEAEKQRRAELREKGKLRYRSLDDAGSQQGTDDDDDDEDAEVVSEFTDDGNVSDHNNAACPGSSQPGDDEPPACDDDKVDDDHQGETPSPAPAGAPSSSSHPATNLASAPYAAAQDEILKKVLPYFTCRPLPTDTVEHIICVCAPYHVLIPYTYRVELSFGNIKKGHAARALLQAFQERAAHAGGGGATGSTRHSKKDMRRREAAAAEAKHSNMADTDASATAAAAAVNPSLVQVLESMDIGECMEQLRGNIKPLNIRMK